MTDLVSIERVGNRQQDAMPPRSCLVHPVDRFGNGGSAITTGRLYFNVFRVFLIEKCNI